MGRMAHIVVGQALDCNKLKIKVVLEPPSSGAISPCTCFGVKSVLTWVRELLKDCVAMDRGHKHSSGRSEIAIRLELRSHHVPNDTQELLPPPPPPASSPGAVLPSTSSSAALSCATAQANTNIDTLTDAEMLELDAQLANFQTIVQMLDDSIEKLPQHFPTTDESDDSKLKIKVYSELRDESRILLDSCPWSMESWSSSFGPWISKALSILHTPGLAPTTHATSSASTTPGHGQPHPLPEVRPQDIRATQLLSSPNRKKLKKR